jgi:mono/diheme cytochrome c family protein
MTPEPVPSTALPLAAPEPRAIRRAVPVWLIILLFLLLYWGMVYFDERSGWGNAEVYAPYHSLADLQRFQPPAPGANELGKQYFDQICALCHNPDGTGKPSQAPPLTGSEFAIGNPNRMIRIPLSGLSGPLDVKGQQWNLSMPAMGATLTDEQLAAVLTYIRQSFGNKASEITPAQVKAVRTEIGNRSQPWSAAELNSVQ